MIGVSYSNIKKARRSDEVFRVAIEDALDSRIELVADSLYASAMGGNAVAQIFFLCNRTRYMGRHDPRKWVNVNRVEVDVEVRKEVDSFLEVLEGKLDHDTYEKVANAVTAALGEIPGPQEGTPS